MSDTIKETKISYYNTQITTSENKTKTTWNSVKSITSKKTICEEVHSLCIDGKVINNHLNISNFLNDYFLSTAERVNNNSTNKVNLDVSLRMYYLFQTFKNPFPNIKVKYISKTEIDKIIKFLKPSDSHDYNEISMKVIKAVVNLMFYLQSLFINWDLSIKPKIFCNKTSI